jgi:uncharacterized protein (TIGR00251 family)
MQPEKKLPFLAEKDGGTLISVYVQPKASKNELAGLFEERLKLRVCAPPVEGEANRECIKFFAALLGLSKSEVRLLKGASSRRKTFLVPMTMEQVAKKIKDADR